MSLDELERQIEALCEEADNIAKFQNVKALLMLSIFNPASFDTIEIAQQDNMNQQSILSQSLSCTNEKNQTSEQTPMKQQIKEQKVDYSISNVSTDVSLKNQGLFRRTQREDDNHIEKKQQQEQELDYELGNNDSTSNIKCTENHHEQQDQITSNEIQKQEDNPKQELQIEQDSKAEQ